MADPLKPLGGKALPGKTAGRGGLGRGLAALLGDEAPATPAAEADAAQARREASELPIEFLRPGKFQPRRHFDEDALKALAQSIREKGLVQPIVARPLEAKDSYEIVAGERRWRAAQLAQLHQIPVIVRPLSDRDALELALIENLQRADLTAIEEARGYQRLMDEFEIMADTLAEEIGKSRSHVANMLRLLELPAPVQGMIDRGELSAGHARAIMKAGPNIEALAKDIVKRGLSVRQAEQLMQQRNERRNQAAGKPVKGKPPQQPNADMRALERSVEDATGLKASLQALGQERTALTITSENFEQLDELVARLTRPLPGRS